MRSLIEIIFYVKSQRRDTRLGAVAANKFWLRVVKTVELKFMHCQGNIKPLFGLTLEYYRKINTLSELYIGLWLRRSPILKARKTRKKFFEIFGYVRHLGKRNTLLFTRCEKLAPSRTYTPSKLALPDYSWIDLSEFIYSLFIVKSSEWWLM